MLREIIAKNLVAAEKASERERLLRENSDKADVDLARALKEICYAAWTNEPTLAQRASKAVRSLFKFSNNEDIRPYVFWIEGIADLTRGKLESTIKNLDQAAAEFRSRKDEQEAANTQVAKIYALALLGRYKEALKCGEQTLRVFEKHGDELAAGKIEKNLGNILARIDDDRQAEKFYLAASSRFRRVGDVEELAMSENSLANTYAELNDFRQAEKFYQLALTRAREAKMQVTVAEIEAGMGNLATFRGKFDEALRLLEQSRRKYEELKMPHQSAIAELEIADIYLELNLAREAVSIYSKVAGELKKLKLQGEEARARANFGRASVLLGDMHSARAELKRSARLYLAEKNKSGAAAVKLNEARLELKLTNYKKVLDLAEEARKLLKSSANIRYKLAAGWLKGEALRKLGRNSEKQLSETLREATRQSQPNIARASLNSLGLIALEKGDTARAKKYFTKSVKLIESLRDPLPAEEFRMAFLADKLAPFENLTKIFLAEGDWKKAFHYAERARSRSLAENLEDIVQNGPTENAPKKLTEKLATVREELNWFYSRLDRASENETGQLQREALLREKQIADLRRQIGSTGRKRMSVRNPASVDFRNLQNQLGANRALIEFVNFEGIISAFVITDIDINFVPEIALENEILKLLEGLQFQFGALRFGSGHLEKFMPELKHRANSYLQKLYGKLLDPLTRFFGERDLIVVPVGALHYVPIHALYNGRHYLVENRRINYSPSAYIWQKLDAKPERKPENALLFGFSDERIPLVNREVRSIKQLFNQAESFIGKRARVSDFIRKAGDFDCLHLACHGQFRPENPLFSSLRLADGHITVRDICGLKLRARIVTLSACETGVNKVFAGEEILGLARGFLSAGAESLVLSLWTVNDAATARMMREFYAEVISGKSASEALRIVQGNFIKRGIHPYYWSPFAIIGK